MNVSHQPSHAFQTLADFTGTVEYGSEYGPIVVPVAAVQDHRAEPTGVGAVPSLGEHTERILAELRRGGD